MRKFLVMSILIAIFWIPIAVQRKQGKNADKLVRKRFAIYTAIYVFIILYVVPRL